jgi:hypothetical protein
VYKFILTPGSRTSNDLCLEHAISWQNNPETSSSL